MDDDYRLPDDPIERTMVVAFGMALPYLIECWKAEREEQA